MRFFPQSLVEICIYPRVAVRSKRSARRETRSIPSFGVLLGRRDEDLDTISY
jgi:hypothetical protein